MTSVAVVVVVVVVEGVRFVVSPPFEWTPAPHAEVVIVGKVHLAALPVHPAAPRALHGRFWVHAPTLHQTTALRAAGSAPEGFYIRLLSNFKFILFSITLTL